MDSGIEIAITGGPPWGFSITGGREHNKELRVSKVEHGGVADQCGLLVGDKVTSINGNEVERRDLAVVYVQQSGCLLVLKVVRPKSRSGIRSDCLYSRRRHEYQRSVTENSSIAGSKPQQSDFFAHGSLTVDPQDKSNCKPSRHQRTSTIDSGISLEYLNQYRSDSINSNESNLLMRQRCGGDTLPPERSYYPSQSPTTFMKSTVPVNQNYHRASVDFSSLSLSAGHSVDNLRPPSLASTSTIESTSSESTITATPPTCAPVHNGRHSFVSSAKLKTSKESTRANTEPRQLPQNFQLPARQTDDCTNSSTPPRPLTRAHTCNIGNSHSNNRRSYHFESLTERCLKSHDSQGLPENFQSFNIDTDLQSNITSNPSSIVMRKPLKSPPHTPNSPPVIPPRKVNASKSTPRQHSASPQKVTSSATDVSHFNFNSECKNENKASKTTEINANDDSSQICKTDSNLETRASDKSGRKHSRESLTQSYYVHQLREKQIDFIPKTRYSPLHLACNEMTIQEKLSPKPSPQATSPHLSFAKRKSLYEFSDLPPAHLPPPLPPRSSKKSVATNKKVQTSTMLGSKSEQHLYHPATCNDQEDVKYEAHDINCENENSQLPHQNKWSSSMPLLARENKNGKSSSSIDLSNSTDSDDPKRFYPDSYIHVRPNIRRGFGGDYRRKFSDSGLSFPESPSKFKPKFSNGDPQLTSKESSPSTNNKAKMLKTYSIAVDNFSNSSSLRNSQSDNTETKCISSCASSSSFSSAKPDSDNNVFEEMKSEDESPLIDPIKERTASPCNETFDVESALFIDWSTVLFVEPTGGSQLNEKIIDLAHLTNNTCVISLVSQKKSTFVKRLLDCLEMVHPEPTVQTEEVSVSSEHGKDNRQLDDDDPRHALIQSVTHRIDLIREVCDKEKSRLDELAVKSVSLEELFQLENVKQYKSKFKRLQDNTMSVLKLLCQLSRRLSNLDSKVESAKPDSSDSRQISLQQDELVNQIKEAQALRKSVHQNQMNLGRSLKEFIQKETLENILGLFRELSTTIVRHQLFEAFIKDDQELLQTIRNEFLLFDEEFD